MVLPCSRLVYATVSCHCCCKERLCGHCHPWCQEQRITLTCSGQGRTKGSQCFQVTSTNTSHTAANELICGDGNPGKHLQVKEEQHAKMFTWSQGSSPNTFISGLKWKTPFQFPHAAKGNDATRVLTLAPGKPGLSTRHGTALRRCTTLGAGSCVPAFSACVSWPALGQHCADASHCLHSQTVARASTGHSAQCHTAVWYACAVWWTQNGNLNSQTSSNFSAFCLFCTSQPWLGLLRMDLELAVSLAHRSRPHCWGQ